MTGQRQWPPSLVAVARMANALFFLTVSAYCLLSYSPFAYGQFIKPNVVPALTDFVIISPWLCLLCTLITTLTLMPQLRGGRGAALARAVVAVLALVAAWAFVTRPMLTIGNTIRGFIIGLAALAIPAAIAVVDHVAWPAPPLQPASRSRLTTACSVAAIAAWATYALAVPVRMWNAAGIELPARGVAIGAGTSLVLDAYVFTALLLAVLAAIGLASLWRSPAAEYWMCVGLLALCTTLILYLLVCASIAFSGGDAWVASAAVGVALAIIWSDVARLRSHPQPVEGSVDAVGLFCAPVAGVRSRWPSVGVLLSLPVVAYFLVDAVSHFDWNFLVQKLGVLIVWMAAFAASHGIVGRSTGAGESGSGMRRAVIVALAVFVLYQGAAWAVSRETADGGFSPRIALDRYTALDPSMRLIRDAQTARSAETAEYYAYLKANTLVPPPALKTPDTPFVDPLLPTPSRKPDIYFFIIDSMRRDYLSPFNKNAVFTPAVAALAKESFVFQRAFTRYSGTALSVPSIWAGGMVIHTLGETPFAGRNTLIRLLNANNYVRMMDLDHIVEEIVPNDPNLLQLDKGHTTMEFDVCKTIAELEQRVVENNDRRPVFFYSLPQNMHISIATHRTVPDGEKYPAEFFAPVASSMRRVDGCLGGFVDFLKRTNRYDNSIIILMSDHGDSLGEEGRWGHAYFIVPEVMRIPLIIHLPSWLKEKVATDLTAVAFSTDVTPSLYALLGYEPRDRGTLFGRPLFVAPDADISWRRREPFLLASSYGAVYAQMSRNGRRLFVVDAVDGRDRLYGMDDDAAAIAATELEVTQAKSAAGRQWIRGQVDAIADMYQYRLPGTLRSDHANQR